MPLLKMADLSSLVIRVAVPEGYAAAVHQGMVAHVSLDSCADKTLTGKVARVYPELDRRMRTRTVELVPEEPANLMPGMFARVRLVLETVPEAVTIPQEAVVQTPNGTQVVYIVDGGKAVMRRVTTGIEQAGRVQIVAGLQPSEKAVVTGNERLKDGMEVRVPAPGGTQGKPGPGIGSQMGRKGGNR
jgi:membrane fusion protein (multidrug efflux system)